MKTPLSNAGMNSTNHTQILESGLNRSDITVPNLNIAGRNATQLNVSQLNSSEFNVSMLNVSGLHFSGLTASGHNCSQLEFNASNFSPEIIDTNFTCFDNVSGEDVINLVPGSLPKSIQTILAMMLGPTIMLGCVLNVLLLVIMCRFLDVRQRVGVLLMSLTLINAVHSALPATAYFLTIMFTADMDNESPMFTLRQVLCHLQCLGMVFTNSANYMSLCAMSVQRYRLVIGKPVGRRFVLASLVLIVLVSTIFTAFQAARPGLTYHICIAPGSVASIQSVQGKSGLLWLLMLPFVVCCGVTSVLYGTICRMVASSAPGGHLYHLHNSLVRPLLSLCLVFLLSYLPVIIVFVVRRVLPLTPQVIHMQMIVNAVNFLGLSISPSVWCMHQRSTMKKVLSYMCNHGGHRHIIPLPPPPPPPPPPAPPKQKKKSHKKKRKRKTKTETETPPILLQNIGSDKNKYPVTPAIQLIVATDKQHDPAHKNSSSSSTKSSTFLEVPRLDCAYKITPPEIVYDVIRPMVTDIHGNNI